MPPARPVPTDLSAPPSGAGSTRGPVRDSTTGPGDRALALQEVLAGWFAREARDLPWRAPDRTPWGVLVSEVMAQQTPVARVAPVWTAWMERWPTPAAFAAAATADVLRAWGTLGYPRRALRLQDCARAIVERHGGAVPRDEPSLLALPGIGTYTAAAVVAFAFGGRSVVVDTNVRRVLARTIGGHALPEPALTAAETARAASIVPAADADAATWAASSMELGAVVCTARAPRCDACPVTALCAWRAAGYPPDEHGARRRTQAWTGTDRQVRGKIMALLRDAHGHVARDRVALVWPDAAQLDRCVAGLVEDGLVEQTGGALHLPG